MWSSCSLGFEVDSLLVREFYQDLHHMSFERTDNDLSYNQFQMINDIMIYVTNVSPLKDS